MESDSADLLVINMFLVAKLLYKYSCPSVCPSVRLSVRMSVRMSVCLSGLGGNVIFSAPNHDRGLISSSFATYGCCHPCYLFGYVVNEITKLGLKKTFYQLFMIKYRVTITKLKVGHIFFFNPFHFTGCLLVFRS